MFKHANTLAPGDRVRLKKPIDEKAAAVQGPGMVASAEGTSFRIAWDDGSFTDHDVSDLEKQ